MSKNVIKYEKWNDVDSNGEKNVLLVGGLISRNRNLGKEEFGSMMLSQEGEELSIDGFQNIRKRVAFIAGRVEDLEKIIKARGIKVGTNYCDIYGEHKIIVKEKLESEVKPRDGFGVKKNPNRDLEEMTHGGEKIYRRTYIVQDDPKYVDTVLEFDKEDEQVMNEPVIEAAKQEFTQGEAVPEATKE